MSRRAVAPILLALLLGGCGAGVPVPAPPPIGADVPDLRGTWAGAWGGAPASLLIMEQAGEGTERGVHVGDWQILGERRPSLSGILTYTDHAGSTVSTNARGWVGGGPRGALSLVVAAESGGGQIVLDLRLAGDRLLGTGESSLRWGPYGAVELQRQ